MFSASSDLSPAYSTAYAFDGRSDTRWASRQQPRQWLAVDFGRSIPLSRVSIHWERACAMDYELQMSTDRKTWTTLHSEKSNPGGLRTHAGLNGQGRFFRILCLKAGRWNLYSIWEVDFPEPHVKALLKGALAKQATAQKQAQKNRMQAITQVLSAHQVEHIVFAARDDGTDGHWYANFGYYAQDDQRKCYRSHGRLCLLHVPTGKLTILVDDLAGSVRDPVVHYDAQKILFSWRRADSQHFHLYEIGVDGGGLRQLTSGPYDDIEPVYLPTGHIMFVSSRCKRWVNCWLTQVGVLYRCNADGGDIRQISANVEHDNTPWVLPDGRVLYQRWEYVDRSQVHYHHLWTTNPDGTGQMVYFGNMHPGVVMIDAKPIPGTDKVLSIFSPGHGQREHSGYVTEVSVDGGPDFHPTQTRISRSADFRDPYPLSEDHCLVARRKTLYLMNRRGETREIYALPPDFRSANLQEPRPVIPRPRERIIKERIEPEAPTGRMILVDAHFGRNMAGIAPGTIKELLVMESLPKPINFTGGMEPLTYGGSFTLERIVGTVPVEADGSAYFELPANRSFFFIALDDKQQAVKRMQSFCSVAPGETTSCIGCHEERTKAPLAHGKHPGRLSALRRPASIPRPVEGVPDVMDYPRDIQPIWDRHCVSCHRPDNRQGGVLMTSHQGPMYSHSYFMLTAREQVSDGRNKPVSNYAPYKLGDAASPLMQKLKPGHHNVKVSAAEKKMIRFWIHAGAPWIGTYAGLGSGMIGGYEQNRIDRRDLAWSSVKAAQDVLGRRCLSCHTQQKGMPLPNSPSDNMNMPPWEIRYGSPKLRFSRHILYNLTRPEKSGLVLAPLAPDAGGWGMQKRDKQGKPTGEPVIIFKNTRDPDYQILLKAIQDTQAELARIGRFNLPGFKPRAAYIREMQRYGLLPSSFDLAKQPVDVYDLDRRYWQSLWYQPATADATGSRP